MVCEIFKKYASIGIYIPISHYSSSQFPVNYAEPNMMSVFENYIVGTTETTLQIIRTHLSCELVEAIVLIGIIWWLHVEVGDWWVMRCVLSIDLSAILELAL